MIDGLKITLVQGDVAPRYGTGMEVKCEEIVITEQGTQANLPMVDFKLRGPGGHFFLLVLTGRQVNALAAIIKGINTRIHGDPEP